MAKISDQDPTFTSFYNVTITSTLGKLTDMFGEPQWEDNYGDNKVNVEWVLETTDTMSELGVPEGSVFTVYDWKEYRPIYINDTITFHIGAKSKMVSEQAKYEIENHELLNLKLAGFDPKDIAIMRDLDII